jgi:hypothetical protein
MRRYDVDTGVIHNPHPSGLLCVGCTVSLSDRGVERYIRQPEREVERDSRREDVLFRYNALGKRPTITGMARNELLKVLELDAYVCGDLRKMRSVSKRRLMSVDDLVEELDRIHGERLMLIQCREWIIRWKLGHERGISAELIRNFPTKVREYHYEFAAEQYIKCDLDDVEGFPILASEGRLIIETPDELADHIGTIVFLRGYGYTPNEKISEEYSALLCILEDRGHDMNDSTFLASVRLRFRHIFTRTIHKMVIDMHRKLPKGTLPEWLLRLHNLPSK